MQSTTVFIIVALLAGFSFWLGRQRSVQLAAPVGGVRHLHSLPSYYGWMTAVWCGLPAMLVLLVWMSSQEFIISQLVIAALPPEFTSEAGSMALVLNEIKNVASGALSEASRPEIQDAADHLVMMRDTATLAKTVLVLCLAIIGVSWGWSRISPELRARNQFENVIKGFLIFSSTLAIFTTVGIVLSVLFEAMRFFQSVPITEFLFGLNWSPQIAIRADQQGSSGAFGAVPLFLGTMLISFLAMLVAVPVGLMSAIYLAEYASPRVRNIAKPVLEVLAGIPTVVYGFFAALVAAPAIRDFFHAIGVTHATSESALAAGVVMGIMIIPFVSSLSDDAINAVPQSLRDGSYGLGATKSETIKQVVIPAALPGIVGGILLAVSRAIGETMIVVMAAGLAANLTIDPLETVTTVTVQIVTLLVGDQEFDSPKTLAAFALGLMLFVTTLALNFIALHVVRKYREQYE